MSEYFVRRDDFEKWAIREFGHMVAGKPESVIIRDRSGEYVEPMVWAAWKGWRSAIQRY